MKLQSNHLLENLTRQELKLLTAEVKETVNQNFNKERKRVFSTADFWNIRRQRKNFYPKRLAF